MKKLILIAFIAIVAIGCKKSEDIVITPNVTNTWLVGGKWKRTLYQDTTFNRTGGFVVTNYTQANEITFIDDFKGKQSTVTDAEFSYSLSKGTIDIAVGKQFHIIKISDTQIKLYATYNTTVVNISRIAWVDIYTKE